MNEFHCSSRGESAKNWLDNSKASRAKLPWPPVKIIFPSLQTVKNTVLGVPVGCVYFGFGTGVGLITLNFIREVGRYSVGKPSGKQPSSLGSYSTILTVDEELC